MKTPYDTIIDAVNMLQARANATNDQMLESLACAIVVMNAITYDELDSDVWPVELYREKCFFDEAIFSQNLETKATQIKHYD